MMSPLHGEDPGFNSPRTHALPYIRRHSYGFVYHSTKKYLVVSAFVLVSLILVGGVFAATYGSTIKAGVAESYPSWLIISYVAGLSMIILPCTLPLVFIIVPMSMGQEGRRGLMMALLFGAGLIITITAYGAGMAILGDSVGLDNLTQYMFGAAGVAAFLFGLLQLRLINLNLPSYSGTPKIIQNRGDHAKALGMGLLLGNAGVGCPNPLFYWLLIYVAGTGSIDVGASLGAVHGLGRAIPLILLSTLAILGINAAGSITASRHRIETASGWMLIGIGSLLIINALPGGHQWYEDTVIHIGWNQLVSALSIPPEFHMEAHTHGDGPRIPVQLVPGMLAVMTLGPVGWYYVRRARE